MMRGGGHMRAERRGAGALACVSLAGLVLTAACARDSEAGLRDLLQGHERTGRPLGDAGFLKRLEALTGRPLAPKKPGRKPAKPGPAKARRKAAG